MRKSLPAKRSEFRQRLGLWIDAPTIDFHAEQIRHAAKPKKALPVAARRRKLAVKIAKIAVILGLVAALIFASTQIGLALQKLRQGLSRIPLPAMIMIDLSIKMLR